MPLPEPVRRTPLHTRTMEMNGYAREDGLFDIEGRITDSKAGTYVTATDKVLAPGEALHDMWIRLVVDENMRVQDVFAVTDSSPHYTCPGAADFVQRLKGVSMSGGWRAAVSQRMAGVEGCAHLKELLYAMASTAFQSLTPVRRKMAEDSAAAGPRPKLIDSCLAYSSGGPLVEQKWPQFFIRRKSRQEGE